MVTYFLVLALAFILTNFYLLSYRSNGTIDTDSIIPGKSLTKQFVKIAVGLLFSLTTFTGYLLLSFLGATLFFGSGKLNYPYIVYTSQTKVHIETLQGLLLKSLPLQLLALVAACLLFYIIALLVKHKLGAIFIALLISVGFLLGVSTIYPIQKIAPFIPTTYINSFAIATGSLAKQIGDFRLSLATGYLVVTLGIIIFSLVIIILNKLTEFKR